MERVHRGLLARQRSRTSTSTSTGATAPADIAYYEATFEEFLRHADGVPQLRVMIPFLEDVFGSYVTATRQVYSLLSNELGLVRGHVDEFKVELEYWRELALRYFEENEALLSRPVEDPDDSKAQELARVEAARLALEEALGQANEEYRELVARHDEVCRESEALSVRVDEMEVARLELTPRPLLLLPVGASENECEGEGEGEDASAPSTTDAPASKASTADKVLDLQERYEALRTENAGLASRLARCLELDEKRSLARQQLEEEAKLEPKGSIARYLDMLEEKGEETWSSQLVGMGQAIDVPKLFRFGGKIRNKQMSKRDTEKMVREVWKDRLASLGSKGSSTLLVDFLGSWLQKKVGIAAAVLEMGYNFLYGLWRYKWDADCELFLKILMGDIREEVYIAQNKLQLDINELFEALDKLNGQATGSIPKEELVVALRAFFKVGKLDGKSEEMFEEALAALETDQPGALVEWRKVFEEDREFNQGAFAECIREQFLTERKHLNDAVAVSLYVECGEAAASRADDTADDTARDAGDVQPAVELYCTKEQFSKALMEALPLMRDEEAANHTATVFEGEPADDAGRIPVKRALKILGEGNLTTDVQDPVAPIALAATGSSKKQGKGTKKPAKQPSHGPLINLALESVRLFWVNSQAVEAKETEV